MANISFRVRGNKKGHLTTVFLRLYSSKEIDLTASTPIKTYPEYWSNKSSWFKQRKIYDNAFTESDEVKAKTELTELKNHVLKEYTELLNTTPTKTWLISVIDKYYNKEITKALNLNSYINNFIKEAESGEKLYNHNGITKRYEKGTIKNYKGFQIQFDNYQKDNKIQLNFNDITIEFYDEFVKYFTLKNYSINTIGRHVKNLKSIMRLAREEGLHNNQEIERKKFKVLRTQVDNIYLTEQEINKIRNIDFNNLNTKQKEIIQKHNVIKISQLEISRDIFLIGCYTAQRFSDFSKIRPAHIKVIDNQLKVLDFNQQKTGERVIIPIRPELDEILKKYDYLIPKAFEQKVNERIKIVGEMVGITEIVIIEEKKGGFTIKKDVPKNELIKTHTARRTGCTLMYLAGVPTLDIMKISGHKSEREFLNYIKVGKEETAHNLSRHPYFIGSHLKIAK
jgi:integrase